MSKNSKQKEPKIDIFVITENGDCIPLKEYTHQLKKKTKEQLAICQKRKVCLEKMIGLSNFKMVCNMVVLGVYLGNHFIPLSLSSHFCYYTSCWK